MYDPLFIRIASLISGFVKPSIFESPSERNERPKSYCRAYPGKSNGSLWPN